MSVSRLVVEVIFVDVRASRQEQRGHSISIQCLAHRAKSVHSFRRFDRDWLHIDQRRQFEQGIAVLVAQFGNQFTDDLFGFGLFLHPAVSRGLPGGITYRCIGRGQAQAFFTDPEFLIARGNPVHQLLAFVMELGSQSFEPGLRFQMLAALFNHAVVKLAIVPDQRIADLFDALARGFLSRCLG